MGTKVLAAFLLLPVAIVLMSFQVGALSCSETQGCWFLENSPNQEILDSSSYGFDGTLGSTTNSETRDPSWSTDSKTGSYSINFNHNEKDYIEIDSYSGAELNRDTFNITATVKPTSYPDFSDSSKHARGIFDKFRRYKIGMYIEDAEGENRGEFAAALITEECKSYTAIGGSTAWCAGSWMGGDFQIPLNTWTKVQFWWNGTHASFYKNGVLKRRVAPEPGASSSAHTISNYEDKPAVIGSKCYWPCSDPSSDYSNTFPGLIDYVKFGDHKAGNSAPTISDEDPKDGEVGVSPGTVTVSANIEDVEGDPTVVEIYNDSGMEIKTATLPGGGPDRVSASYDAPDYGKMYEWKVSAYTEGQPSKETVKVYHFRTSANPKPQVTNYYPPNGTKMKPGDFERNVTITNQPSGEPVSVTFYEGGHSPSDIIGTDNIPSGSGTARVSSPAKGNGNSFTWYADISDGTNTVTKIYNYNTFDDVAPSISKATPKNGDTVQKYPVPLAAYVEDDFDSSIDVEFQDGAGNTIKTTTVGNGEFANASMTGVADETYNDWTVTATDDSSQSTSATYTFFYEKLSYQPVRTYVDYNYTSSIISKDTSSIVPIVVKNSDTSQNLKTSIDSAGVDAEFVEGGTSKSYTLGPNERKQFLIKISPSSTGKKKLIVDTKNTNYNIVRTAEIPVYVREYPIEFQENRIPGIGGIQLYVLAMLSTAAYFVLL
jgi:hypothetical protein